MHLFRKSPHKWWRKPLVQTSVKHLPAELVVLAEELQDGESGAWLNSRGTTSGVVDLVEDRVGRFKAVRSPLPVFVRARLQGIYRQLDVRKGIPDLVIWKCAEQSIRFVEVKCPRWDRASAEQLRLHEICRSMGYAVSVREWLFVDLD
jgi:hypothetical protein